MRPLSLLPIVLFLRTSGAALAAVPGEEAVDPALRDESRALYVAAVKDMDALHWAEGRAKLFAAWKIFPHWSLAANLAQCEVELGRFRDAAEHAAYYLANAPADRHDKARALLDRALPHVGTLSIRVGPSGAEVLVDGALVGRAPLPGPLYLEPGEHQVSARHPWRIDASRAVVLAAGEKQTIEIRLWSPVVTTGVVVTGVGVVVGAALAGVAAMKASDADSKQATLKTGSNPCPANVSTCAAIDGDRRAHDALTKGMVGAFAASAGVIGAARPSATRCCHPGGRPPPRART